MIIISTGQMQNRAIKHIKPSLDCQFLIINTNKVIKEMVRNHIGILINHNIANFIFIIPYLVGIQLDIEDDNTDEVIKLMKDVSKNERTSSFYVNLKLIIGFALFYLQSNKNLRLFYCVNYQVNNNIYNLSRNTYPFSI